MTLAEPLSATEARALAQRRQRERFAASADNAYRAIRRAAEDGQTTCVIPAGPRQLFDALEVQGYRITQRPDDGRSALSWQVSW